MLNRFIRPFAGIVFLFALQAWAQVVPGRYIIELNQPLAAKNANGMAQARAGQLSARARVATLGGEVLDSLVVVSNALIVNLPGDNDQQMAALAAMPDVKRITRVHMMKTSMEVIPGAIGADTAWRNYGGVDKAGAGIKIGIIDTGIDFQHAAFQDSSLKPPPGYPKGDAAFTNNKVIVARSYISLYNPKAIDQTPTDLVGHGTAVAMVAAGVVHMTPRGTASGMAPKAFLGAYRANAPGAVGEFSTAAIYKALDDAVADGMDVINLSLGSAADSLRPEFDPFVDMVSAAAARGVVVVVAAGNDGPDPMTVNDLGQGPVVLAVGATRHPRVLASSVLAGTASYQALNGSTTSVTRADLTASLVDIAPFDPTGLACDPLPTGRLTGSIALILRGNCTFSVKIANAATSGAVGVVLYTAAASDDPFTFEQGSSTLPALMVGNADGLALKAQTRATMHFVQTTGTQNHRRLVSFSSIGPSTGYDIKPDLVTVGSEVYTAKPGGGYVSISGTSFSSPIVAGTVAFLKGARPGLTVQQYRSLVINSAQWMDERLEQRGNGSLNVDQAANSTITASPASVSFGISGVNANASRRLEITNVGRATETFAITVFPLTAGPAPTVSTSQVTLAPGQSAPIDARFVAQGLPGGERNGLFIIRGAASGAQIYVPYWHGVPTNVPAKVSVLFSDDSAARGTSAFIDFRMLDADGMAAVGPVPTIVPTADSAAAGATLQVLRKFDVRSPGLWEAQVRMRSTSGISSYTIHADGAPDVVIAIPTSN